MLPPFGSAKATRNSAPDDRRRVMDAAEILCVREVDLFRLAWFKWHGARGDDRAIERAFVRYMFHGVVPPWVRHFARAVVADAERGRLQPQPHGVIQRRPEPATPWPGAVYVAIVMAVTVLFVLVLSVTPGSGDDAQSMVCGGGEGLRFYAQFAYAFSGRPPPDCV
ncbi:MAG: hypothetical protein GY791_11370 [Alphaproteobacteria bacterium]|nr:hypothetical protein [Alphaproteobacteria bacterium]